MTRWMYPEGVEPTKEWGGRFLEALVQIRRGDDNEWRAKVYDAEMILWDLTLDEDQVEDFLTLFGVRFILLPVNVEGD